MKNTAHYVAVVHGPRGVRFVSVASSRDEREYHVGDYVRSEAEHQLSPRTRTQVLELLARGALAEGIAVYFGAVGAEWEPETLHLETVNSGHSLRPTRLWARPWNFGSSAGPPSSR